MLALNRLRINTIKKVLYNISGNVAKFNVYKR